MSNLSTLNFRHLHYFWVVAKEGSVTKAAQRLGLAIQTVSAQLGLLEQSVGKSLFSIQGRRLVLTETGRITLRYADQIFLLAEQLQDTLAETDSNPALRLTVGLSDTLPKMISSRLLDAVLSMSERVKLICYEEQFESLLGQLSVHKLDVVLTDRPVPSGTTLRVFSHLLGETEISLFGTSALAKKYAANFPSNLNGAPFLLPTRNNAIRSRIDYWLETHEVKPDIIGEFDDNALLHAFGRNGRGLFPAPTLLADDVLEQLNAQSIGVMAGVREQFYAISNERKIKHPAVEMILTAMHGEVFKKIAG